MIQKRAESLKGTGDCTAVALTETAAPAVVNLVSSGAPLPDAVVTDSLLWRRQLDASLTKRKLTATTGEVFATTPVVIAVPGALANPMNTGVKPWMQTLPMMPFAAATPSDNTASALAFVSVWQVMRNNPVANAAMGDAFFRLLRESPTQASLLAPSQTAKAFPATEQQIATARAAGNEGLRAMIPAEGVPFEDFALTTLGTPQGDKARVLKELDAALRDDSARQDLLDAGFRVDGKRSVEVPDIPATVTASENLEQREFNQITHDWAYLSRDLRLLMIVDVSGSMLAKDGNSRRIDLAVGAVQQVTRLLKPTSDAGLWVFSTAQRGTLDYRSIAPVRMVGDLNSAESHGSNLLRVAAGMPTFVRGDTGLNDTILAAHQAMTKIYAADRDNLIVILTDGRNDDTTGGLSTDQLIARLKSSADPERPVRVVVVGVGTKEDQAVMARVTAQVNGRAYYVTDSSQIPAAFADAVWTINRR